MELSKVYEYWAEKHEPYDGPIDPPMSLHFCWNPAHGWCNHPGCQDYYKRLAKPNEKVEFNINDPHKEMPWHWDDCWRRHLPCALARIERLEKALARLLKGRKR